jgi:hypothetical protein
MDTGQPAPEPNLSGTKISASTNNYRFSFLHEGFEPLAINIKEKDYSAGGRRWEDNIKMDLSSVWTGSYSPKWGPRGGIL